MSRSLVHLDADAFFASVEQAADQRLRDRPIAVGGERRGIIASASYEARRFGVFTPMPTARARKLCPKLIVLPGDYERYEQFSRWMFNYCYDFTPDVEQTSIDEGYFDLTANRKKPPAEIALTIRQAIGQSLKISVSEGLASNKLLSQIASKLSKPANFREVLPGHERQFLHPLPNKWLPGIGPKTSARLNAAGLAEVRHIAATPPELLELVLGNQAPLIYQFAHGIDERPLIPAREPQKSFSQQETFGQDVTDEEYIEATLRRMADHLFAKVREEGKSIRTLTVKVRYNDMAEDQCSESLPEPTDLETDVYGRLRAMLKQAWKRRVSLRLISLKLANVYNGVTRSDLPLDRESEQHDARERLARVIDELRKLRGQTTILRGHDFRLREKPAEPQRQRAAGILPAEQTSKQSPELPARCRQHVCDYVPLRVHSYYSFLDSTLSPEAIVALARQHGCPAVALTDTGNLHGVVEFVQAAQKADIKPIIGVELRLGNQPLLLYVKNARGYTNLCRLLSPGSCSDKSLCSHDESTPGGDNPSPHPARKGQGEGERGELSVADFQRRTFKREQLTNRTDGLIAVSPDTSLAELFPGAFYQMAARCGLTGKHPVVVCPDIRYATPQDRMQFDIVQSIRTRTLLRQAHPEKRLNGRFHFRTPAEMQAGCREHPDWLAHSREIADHCQFDFPFGKPQFPAYQTPDSSASREFLRQLVIAGLRARYHGRRIVSDTGAVVPWSQVQAQVETELEIIAEVGYEDLFLITWDLLQTCREHGIEWITRGSAADSLVCYCLGISDVCPIRFGLYFRRFLNKERMALHKLPDIDVDFPHDRKDDVIQLLFDKYGPEQCAIVGGFSTFQARSAVGDVAKVLGVSEFQIRRFTEHFPWGFGGGWVPEGHHRKRGSELLELLRASPECHDLPLDEEPFKTAVEIGAFLDGFPRHPKMHPCGVVLSRQPMHELTPTFTCGKGWPTTHLDMDAVESIGLVKMDILAQGGLATMRDTKEMLREQGIAVDLRTCTVMPAAAQDSNDSFIFAGDDVRSLILPLERNQRLLTSSSTVQELNGADSAESHTPIHLLTPAATVQGPEARNMLSENSPPYGGDRGEQSRKLFHRMTALSRSNRGQEDPLHCGLRIAHCGLRGRVWHAALEGSLFSNPQSAIRNPQFNDPAVWEMIASGGARAVHHIESPAMTSLCRMSNVREIDGLIAIVSVIRPGAANEQKKIKFTRRYQKMEPPEYPHPSLESCLRSTFGLVVYEEHILQICEAFAGLSPGRADVLRRALVKQKRRDIETIGVEFVMAARARGHDDARIKEVWELVTGFNGYAFCKAHSTAYGVEAYQAAWLKRYFPAEFMAAVLTNGKGFYHPLVYVLECHRLGIPLLPPSVNEPGPAFSVVNGGLERDAISNSSFPLTLTLSPGQREQQPLVSGSFTGSSANTAFQSFKRRRTILALPKGEVRGEGEPDVSTLTNSASPATLFSRDSFATSIRVPLTHAKGLTERTTDRILAEREHGRFNSLADFYRRVAPSAEEMETLIRVGAFDEFGETRTRQFWEFQHLHQRFGQSATGQGWLLPPPGLEKLPEVPLVEPTRRQRLLWEAEYFGFTASGHPLELHGDIAWETYCPVSRLGEHIGEEIVTCGLVIEQRTHHQITGEPMKFLTLADWTGMIETELFADTYKSYGLATVRYPVLEITARVEPFENGRGCSLRALRAGKPRRKS